ncbi:hypothetical protein MPSEU_000933600 [Mayamaea pseudoterrestris]|nr:hypothetical protein MPSEU_000933600 [Mayamaea pseudoterrestris]
MADEPSEPENQPKDEVSASDPVIGSAALRPLFLGNLFMDYSPETVKETFELPFQPSANLTFESIPVDRIDNKRGFCFVYLKDAKSEADKERIEAYVKAIEGVKIPQVSNALRIEFARGDGRVKRKEDERRRNIAPSDTLFVVNFHEATTRREDLEMLFGPFGELQRIDMKRNYAFVQFQTIEQATKAKEATNGGKLDQSVLTVEYVASRSASSGGGGGGRRGDGYGDRRGGGGRDRNYDRDRRGPPRGGGGRDRYEDRYERRSRSPPRYRDDRRPRSRSRSPPRYNDRSSYRGSRSPPRYDDRDFRDRRPHSPDAGYRARSPDRDRDGFRGDRDRGMERGYRS